MFISGLLALSVCFIIFRYHACMCAYIHLGANTTYTLHIRWRA